MMIWRGTKGVVDIATWPGRSISTSQVFYKWEKMCALDNFQLGFFSAVIEWAIRILQCPTCLLRPCTMCHWQCKKPADQPKLIHPPCHFALFSFPVMVTPTAHDVTVSALLS